VDVDNGSQTGVVLTVRRPAPRQATRALDFFHLQSRNGNWQVQRADVRVN
jgi:hypothetical protein